MYLKRLEIMGFKSFPEKIKLEFNKGITAVVGPNGSGKSNVSDAVRWVLGEQSPKSLRGAKMEDVIFAGTANRRPLGFAEVTLVIDNQDRAIDIDYSEISVTRRVFRHGESEYRLNGSPCRLKDINELFMDTGIGKEGYSIIGQGKIEEILSSRSEDRRLLFEEAAGIVKYKSRRFEALSKLDKERQNIQRINDIISEIESQLAPLEKSAATAKRYLLLIEKLKLTRINIFIQEISTFEDKLNTLDADISNIESQADAENLIKEQLREEIVLVKEDSEAIALDICRNTDRLGEIRSMLEQTENDIVLAKEQECHIKSEIYNLTEENKRFLEAIADRLDAKAILSEQLDANRENYSKTANLLKEKLLEYDCLLEEMGEDEKIIESLNAGIYEEMKVLNGIAGELQKIGHQYEQMEKRKEELNLEIYSSKVNLSQRKTLLNSLEDKREKAEEGIGRLNNSIAVLRDEKNDFTGKKQLVKECLSQTTRKIHELSARLNTLRELESSYEGYQKPIKSLLQSKDKRGLKGIVGAVGELAETSQQFETAIEIALGQSLQNIVTNNEADARAAIDFLKKNNLGRATFLPISAVKPRELRDRGILEYPGVLGVAKELIKYKPEHENIFSSLLGNVIIADNLENAVSINKAKGYTYRIVTLDGDVVNPGGAMTGGSINKKASGIFGRPREIKEIGDLLAELSKKEASEERKLNSINSQLNAILIQEEENKNLLHQMEIEKTTTNEQLGQLYEIINNLDNRITELSLEDSQLMEEIVSCNEEIRVNRLRHKDKEAEIEGIRSRLNDAQREISASRMEKDRKSGEITGLKVEIGALEEKINALSENLRRMEQSISGKQSSIGINDEEIEKKTVQAAEKAERIEKLYLKIDNFKVTQGQLHEKSEVLNKKRGENVLKLNELEASFIEKSDILATLKNEQTRLELSKTHLNQQMRSLYDMMWEEYEITYTQALKYERLDYTLSKLQAEEKTCKNQIKELGNVNVNAVTEFKLLTERYQFLTKQRDDILEAEEKLTEIITQLTGLMEQQFAESFKVISGNFNRVFTEMFCGGRASLKLTDEKNLLESGIEIIAQPPGKALQNMSLLSGGERALTATALLFSILGMKPSPFCILDEIESALDDANVIRYADYLKNFCKNTQFILITHRKGVMEAADVLYGITMQEQGVSKMVSVKFEESA